MKFWQIIHASLECSCVFSKCWPLSTFWVQKRVYFQLKTLVVSLTNLVPILNSHILILIFIYAIIPRNQTFYTYKRHLKDMYIVNVSVLVFRYRFSLQNFEIKTIHYVFDEMSQHIHIIPKDKVWTGPPGAKSIPWNLSMFHLSFNQLLKYDITETNLICN